MNFDRNAKLVGLVLLAVIIVAIALAFWSNWMWPPPPVGAQ